MITIFMDGGAAKWRPEKHQYVLSWGIVAHHGDSTTELYGSKIDVPHHLHGYHEMMAFLEAMRFAKGQGFLFENMSFYTDDPQVSYAGFMLHPANFVATDDVDKFKRRFQTLCLKYYDEGTYQDALECLVKSRFTKVKGHDTTVYNLRVDHLARHAREVAAGKEDVLDSFEDWLAQGFYSNPYDAAWFAPFAVPSPAG